MPVKKLRYLLMVALLAMALGLVACGSDDSSSDEAPAEPTASGTTIEADPANGDTPTLTIGSKNFTEQIVLGEIYAQALEAAGYNVKTDLNLGSETVALAALKKGEISGYPEYISTALTSFYDTAPEDVPGDVNGAYEMAKQDLAGDGI